MALTEELLKDFDKTQAAPESKRKESVKQLCSEIREAYTGNHFSVIEDVDFGKLVAGGFGGRYDDLKAGGKLAEDAITVTSHTSFPDLLGTTITVGMLEFAERAPVTATNLVNTINTGCGQEVFYGYHSVGDIVDDECMNEQSETPYKGICPPNKVTLPERCKKKFAMGIAREMLCHDVNGMVQNLMRTGAEIANLHNGKIILKHIFGLNAAGRNANPYIYNDVAYDPYHSVGGAAPWENQLVNNPLDGTVAPFNAIEILVDDQRDPWNGEPTNAQYRDVLVSSIQARDLALRGMNTMQVAYDLPDQALDRLISPNSGVNGRAENVTLGPKPFGAVTYDRYARDLLIDFYTDVVKLSAADAKLAASATYLVGNIREAFAWAVEWPFESLERVGTDTREYFDQEIVYQIKYLWKAAPLTTSPWSVVRCVPDVTAYASYAANSSTFTWS